MAYITAISASTLLLSLALGEAGQESKAATNAALQNTQADYK